MNKPREPHLQTAYHVLPYLKSTVSQDLFFSSASQIHLKAFYGAGCAACFESRRTTIGYSVFFIGDSPISWKSKKQSTVSRFSAEAECRAMAVVAKVQWLLYLLVDFQISHVTPALHIAKHIADL